LSPPEQARAAQLSDEAMAWSPIANGDPGSFALNKGSEEALRRLGSEGRAASRVPDMAQGVVSGERSVDTAAENAPTFYSQLQRTLEEKMPNRAQPTQIQGILRGSQVKPDEIKWTGFDDFLDKARAENRPVTKQEALDYLKQNEVQVQEVRKGALTAPETARLDELDQKIKDGHQTGSPGLQGAELEEYTRLEGMERDASNKTKYQNYQIPGGENYRELLLTLPKKEVPTAAPDTSKWRVETLNDNTWTGQREIRVLDENGQLKGQRSGFRGTDEEAIANYAGNLQASAQKSAESALNYHSGHFSEPNILAHVRFNDRVDAQGKKVLFVEEVQSDWHQAGRKGGYKRTPESMAQELTSEYRSLADEWDSLNPTDPGHFEMRPGGRTGEIETRMREIRRLQELGQEGAVPDAPFQKTWPELAMKRVVRWASENGYDKVAWTTGEQQAARYDLAKAVREVTVNKGEHGLNLTVTDHDGRNIMDSIFYSPAEYHKIEDSLGKELAEKIIAQNEPEKVYTGLDLKVGGEGMKGFYDRMLPEVMNKLGKKFGARVGETEISTGPGGKFTQMLRDGETSDRTVPVHSIDITPQMKESVLTQGQPLFLVPSKAGEASGNQQVGRIGAQAAQGAVSGAAGEYQNNPDAGPLDYGRAALGGAAERVALGQARRGLGPNAGGTIARVVRTAGKAGQSELNRPRTAEELAALGGKPITLSTEEEIARLRLDKFPAEIRDHLQQAATDSNFWHDQRRGVIPDDVAEKLANEWGPKVDAWANNPQAGRAYNEEQMLAIKNAIKGQGLRVRAITEEIGKARDAGESTIVMQAQRIAEMEKMKGYQAVMEGARAESGRSFRANRLMAQDLADNPDFAAMRILKRLGSEDDAMTKLDQLNEIIKDGADPIQMAKFWKVIEKGPVKPAEWYALVRRNSMLSGPRTVEVNAVSNMEEIAYEALMQAGKTALRGNIAEAGNVLASPFMAMGRASQDFMRTLRGHVTDEMVARGDIPAYISERVDNPVGKRIAQGLEAPDRLNAAVDSFGMTMAEQLGMTVTAGDTATAKGLKGHEWTAEVIRLLDDHPEEIADQAHAFAQNLLFKGEMGVLGQKLRGLQQVPIIGNWLLPFLTTTYHIGVKGIDRSPLGLFTTAQEVARSKIPGGGGAYTESWKGNGVAPPIGRRLRDNAVGTAIYAWGWDQANRGNITGAGPDDPEKRAELRTTGWRPYSVKIGDTYMSYANWGPLAVPLAMASAASEAPRYAKKDASAPDVFMDGAKRTAQVVQEMSVVAGLGAISNAMTDPERYGTQWLSQFVASHIPYGSALNTLGQATDPVDRRADRQNALTQISQNVEARVPGLRTAVPPSQDPLGRPVENTAYGPASLVPSRISRNRDEPVIRAFLDAGVDIGAPAKEISLGNGKVKIDLTPEERRAWQSARGEFLSQFASDVSGRSWEAMAPEQRQKVLKGLLEKGSTYAERAVLSQMDSDPSGSEARMKVPAGVR
jgi:hypothetical protein